MSRPDQVIEQLHDAHAQLLSTLEGLPDATVGRPSLLPGWTIGHLLTHIARNADSVVRRLDGAGRDEIVDQYPGGPAGREAEIVAGADRPANDLVADVRSSGLAVEEAAARLPEDAWQRLSRGLDGSLVPASMVLFSRVREVEVHHVDLGLGYRPADWPAQFVTELMVTELARLPQRGDPVETLAWIIGRGPAPVLGPWR